jgi:hypothetical protein
MTQFISPLTGAQREEFARRLNRATRLEVADYASTPDPEVEHDRAEVDLRNVDLYFRLLAERRPPELEDLQPFVEAARRRFHQGYSLEAILHSWLVSVRVLWDCMLELGIRDDLELLGRLSLEYADRVSTAVASAYLEEREQSRRSHDNAARLFFTRMVEGEFHDEATALEQADQLGYDLRRTHIAVVIGPTQGIGPAPEQVGTALARVGLRMHSRFGDCPSIPLPTGQLWLVESATIDDVATMVRAALAVPGSEELPLVAGIGLPRPGALAAVRSYREAARARTLGTLLHPERRVHRYDEIQVFDLFKPGPSLDAFVRDTLGPLLRQGRGSEGGNRLIETLDTYLSTGLNRKQAARRLGIHTNTLDYRLAQIQRLLGPDYLVDPALFRIQLALKLLPMVTTHRLDGDDT